MARRYAASVSRSHEDESGPEGYWVVADANGVSITRQNESSTGPLPPAWAITPRGERFLPDRGRFLQPLPPGSQVVVAGVTVYTVQEPAVEANVLWSRLQSAALERLHVYRQSGADGDETRLDVTLLGVVAGAPTSAALVMVCDAAWRLRDWHLCIDIGDFAPTTIRPSSKANEVERVTDLEHVAVQVSPGAFLAWDHAAYCHLPILRSRGAEREFDVDVNHVTLGNAEIRSFGRHYKLLRQGHWRYTDMEPDGLQGEITVDGHGLLLEEVAAVRRVLTPHGAIT